VLLSGRGSGDALAGEERVKNAGADWTMVRPGWFNQNFSEAFYVDFVGAVRSGELALPFGDFTEAFVDADDIADVVVAALTDDRHIGRAYELSGPRLLGLADVAAELSDATGREITYTPLTAPRYRVVLREQGLPEEYADIFALALNGDNAFLVHGVEEVLGRKPKDFADFAREAAATGVWNA
jgi:uncharacterized protein YbjT (DUF2867 family)